jgi:hypothetical protein
LHICFLKVLTFFFVFQNELSNQNIIEAEYLIRCLIVISRNFYNIPLLTSCDYIKESTSVATHFIHKVNESCRMLTSAFFIMLNNCNTSIFLIFVAYFYWSTIWWIYKVFIIIVLSFTLPFSGMSVWSIPNMALFRFISNERFRYVQTSIPSFYATCRSCSFYFWYV